jgi:hypothetical protein
MNSDDVKRLFFYEKQYLGARDFLDEQSYHIEMRRRHLIAHHLWGVVAGLRILQDPNSKLWFVEPGFAIDGFGREILVFDPEPLNTEEVAAQLAGQPRPAMLKVWIAYRLEKSDRPAPNFEACDAAEQFMRVRETFRLVYQDDPVFDLQGGDPTRQSHDDPLNWPRAFQDLPEDARWPVFLGTLTWDADPTNPAQNVITSVAQTDPQDNGARRHTGVVAQELVAPHNYLLDAVPPPAAPTPPPVYPSDYLIVRARGNSAPLTSDAAKPDFEGVPVKVEGSLEIDRRLSVLGSAGIGTGTLAVRPDTKLHVSGGTDATLSKGTGHVVVGAVTARNLVLDDHALMARDNEGTAELGLQSEGGDLIVHKNQAGKEFVVKDSGNVGIGTAAPSARLEVGAGKFVVLDSGNVGVGTAAPAERLEIGGGGNLAFKAAAEDAGDIIFQNQAGDQKGRVWSNTGPGAALFLSSGDTTPDLAIDATGKVGIGIGATTPARTLHVEGQEIHSGGAVGGFSFADRNTGGFVASPGQGQRWVLYAQGTKAHLWSGSNKLTVTPDGLVGLGTDNPVGRLTLNGITSPAQQGSLSFFTPTGDVEFHGGDDNVFIIRNTGGVGSVTSFLGGRFGIHSVAPLADLDINGTLRVTGNVITLGDFIDISDSELKQNVEPIEGALETLLRLRGVTYQWKEPDKHANMTGPQLGMIAQEVEKVLPQWVVADPEGNKGLTYRGFEALVVEAVRELSHENEELKAKNSELEARLAALEARLDAAEKGTETKAAETAEKKGGKKSAR